MHSRIIQLTKQKVDPDEIFTAEDIICDDEQTFIGEVADYVQDVGDANEANEINWFCEVIGNSHPVEYDEAQRTIMFKDGFRESYFKRNFELFKEEAQSITLEEFSLDKNVKVWKLKNLLEDRHGFYIWFENRPVSLDRFVRDYLELDVTYHIGGVVDYHF